MFEHVKHGETADDEVLFTDNSREVRAKLPILPFSRIPAGKFLYQPMMYDLAADYFQKANAAMFQRRQGRFCRPRRPSVTPAQHDWAGQFEWGYAAFATAAEKCM